MIREEELLDLQEMGVEMRGRGCTMWPAAELDTDLNGREER